MNTTESTQRSNTVQDILEPLETAIALGAVVPAPLGSQVFLVGVSESENGRDYNNVLGVCNSHEDGKGILLGYIFKRWSDRVNVEYSTVSESQLYKGLDYQILAPVLAHCINRDQVDSVIMEHYSKKYNQQDLIDLYFTDERFYYIDRVFVLSGHN